ncbi:MAG: SDR family NAD(P)-dependent oxidoreductase [Hyphomonadaceae bacterium]
MDLQLQGKRALVTGSSAGIGAGVAHMLAAEGAQVIVHGRNAERTRAVADAIGKAGGTAVSVIGDLESEASAGDVIKGALEAFGGVDILVNNAGGRPHGGAKGDFFSLTADDWADTYNMNVLAAVRLIRAFAPPMKEGGWGRIINISSLAGQAGTGNVAEYAAAKSATTSLSLSLSKAMTQSGVTINTISPGMVRTAALEDLLRNVAERQGLGPDVEKGAEWMLKNSLRQTVSRLGAPEDIAYAVCFLASPRSDFINGANFRVDGGAAPAIN